MPKYVEKGGGNIRGNTPGMDILTTEEGFVPKFGYGHEWWRAGGSNPVEHTYHPEGMFVPPYVVCPGWVMKGLQ